MDVHGVQRNYQSTTNSWDYQPTSSYPASAQQRSSFLRQPDLSPLVQPLLDSLVRGASGATGARGATGTAGIPSYANQYIGSGKQWLDAANILKTASPEAFGQMAAQYQQAQNPLGTELGKMLLHAGLIPQNADAMRMSMDALSFQWNNLISTLE